MLINFKVNLRTINGEHTIYLPQYQNEFDQTLTSIGIFYGKDSEYIITSVTCNLKKINNSIRNATDIEELNFLSQILSYFYSDELKTFESIVSYLGGMLDVQKLINIAYNFFDLDIIHSFITNNILSENRHYNRNTEMLTTNACNDSNIIDLRIKRFEHYEEKISDIKSITNLYLVLENCYNENFCLDYDHGEDFILKLRLSTLSSGRSVEFSIPASENVIKRALARLGVESLDDCLITRFSSWSFDELVAVDWNNDIEELNALVAKIKTIKHNDILDYLKGVRYTKAIKCIDTLSIYTDLFNRVLCKSFY